VSGGKDTDRQHAPGAADAVHRNRADGVVRLAYAPASAQEREPIDVSSLGPQVGEKIPDFALPDQYGRTRTLDTIMGERGAMLVFHRSADW